ncbi:hypothetical protein BC830DRAFT_350089 [Chytriomyces sp. MP71]|nr:hypothetical protein BC830DRAFT_350089 [Chytriomyces sp. MP71]
MAPTTRSNAPNGPTLRSNRGGGGGNSGSPNRRAATRRSPSSPQKTKAQASKANKTRGAKVVMIPKLKLSPSAKGGRAIQSGRREEDAELEQLDEEDQNLDDEEDDDEIDLAALEQNILERANRSVKSPLKKVLKPFSPQQSTRPSQTDSARKLPRKRSLLDRQSNAERVQFSSPLQQQQKRLHEGGISPSRAVKQWSSSTASAAAVRLAANIQLARRRDGDNVAPSWEEDRLYIPDSEDEREQLDEVEEKKSGQRPSKTLRQITEEARFHRSTIVNRAAAASSSSHMSEQEEGRQFMARTIENPDQDSLPLPLPDSNYLRQCAPIIQNALKTQAHASYEHLLAPVSPAKLPVGRRRWTEEETACLEAAMKRYGTNWTGIEKAHGALGDRKLVGRGQVDLKDKARNELKRRRKNGEFVGVFEVIEFKGLRMKEQNRVKARAYAVIAGGDGV